MEICSLSIFKNFKNQFLNNCNIEGKKRVNMLSESLCVIAMLIINRF